MSRLDTSDPAIMQAVDGIRDGSSGNDWACFEYTKGQPKLRVADQGSDGVDEILDVINDGKCQFFFLKMSAKGIDKFLYIAWSGEGVQGMMKGNFQRHAKELELQLSGKFHVQINARNEDDIDETHFRKLLDRAAGASYEAGGKIQGNKQGGVTSVRDGVQKVTTDTGHKVKKQDEGKIGLDKKDQFWQKTQQDQEKDKDFYAYQAQRNQKAYNVKAEDKEAFWSSNPATEIAIKKAREDSSYQVPTEMRDSYWDEHQYTEVQKQRMRDDPSYSVGDDLKAGFWDENQYQESTGPPTERSKLPAAKPLAQPEPEADYGDQADDGYGDQADDGYGDQADDGYGEQPAEPEPEAAEPEAVYDEPEAYDEGYAEEEAAPEEAAYDEGYAEEEAAAPEEAAYDEGYAEEEAAPEEAAYEEGAADGGWWCVALYDYAGESEGDLAFAAGDNIYVTDDTDPDGWYYGDLNGVQGSFPSNYVEAAE